jgi:beta-glucanase (GH16 family)
MVHRRVDNSANGPEHHTRRSLTAARRQSRIRLRRARTRILSASVPTMTITAVVLTGLGATSLTVAARSSSHDDTATIASRQRTADADKPGPRPKRTTPAPVRQTPRAKPTKSTAPATGPTASTSTAAVPSKAGTGSTDPSDQADSPFTGRVSVESWASSSSPLYSKTPHAGSTVSGGQSQSDAADGKALALTIPAGAGASPDNSAEVESKASYLYGSFSSRVRTADCGRQPNTGAVTGIFTYGNDGRDHDGDGITDNSEIDVEILCARPDVLNLTIWTDFDDASNAQQRVSRVIDLKAGKILSTCYLTSFDGPCNALSGAESKPSGVPAVAGFDSSAAYHDYRIDWTADRVVFTATDGTGKPITLWDYEGPSTRIPHRSSQYLLNLWHTNDWTPNGSPSAVRPPDSALTAFVDSSTVTETS